VTRKLIAATLVLLSWVGGTALGSLAGAVPAAATPLLTIGRAHANYLPTLDGTKPIFILILGSDARPGTPVDRGLSDSIHILGINPAAKRATLYGIPRDSYVPLTTGGTNKINAAMPAGGPQAEIATVEAVTGIKFDYYMLTGFVGLTKAVDELGGLTIDIPYTVVGDIRTFDQGVHTLDGPSALGYARTRHSLPLGDFDRSMNQGRLMIAALQQFKGAFAKDPTALYAWLGAGLRNVQTSLSIDELTTLAFLASQVSSKKVTNLVAYGHSATVAGSSIVQLDASNQAMWQDLATHGYILQKDIPAVFQPGG
jgi:cell envelope-related function transcriptional attenuator common domain